MGWISLLYIRPMPPCYCNSLVPSPGWGLGMRLSVEAGPVEIEVAETGVNI